MKPACVCDHGLFPSHLFFLRAQVGDDYPFAAPVRAAFTHRVLHVNFGIGLDGHTTMYKDTANTTHAMPFSVCRLNFLKK